MPGRNRHLLQNRGGDDRAGFAGERRAAGCHLVQHEPERKEIGSRVEGLASELLR